MKDIFEIAIQKSNLDIEKPIIVALSGGVDSMVLFDVLYKAGFKLIIAHVNHNKRIESKMEYKNIQEIANSLNVPFEGLVLNKNIEGNFQEIARKKRYTFFTAVAKEYNTDQIVLAHHADDQIETILMRLTRGTSFKGYSGISNLSQYNNCKIIRPLLTVTKEQIIEYAHLNKLTYFEDTSNNEDSYTRNRFRNNIIPLLLKENPLLHSKLEQFSNYISMADEFIDKKLTKFTSKHIFDGKVDIKQYSNVDEILKFKIIQHIVNNESDNTVEVSYTQYQDIINLLEKDTPNVKYNLSKGFELIKEYSYFFIREHKESERVFLEINDVGEYSVSKEIKYVFSFEKQDIRHSNFFEVWYNELVFPLYLRNKDNGDKMKLKVGTKKVKDILIDQKVPSSIRESLILLSNNDTVMWIPRIKKAEQNKEQPNKLYIYEVR